MAGRQTPLLGCDGHLPTGQLLPAVCNRLRRCCYRVGRHPQGGEIQRTGRPVHLPARCCEVFWPHEMWCPQVPSRRWSEDFACLETTGKPHFCFHAFLFCYFVSILFCCTTVLSWTTARNISLSILSLLFNFFLPSFFRGFKQIIIIIILIRELREPKPPSRPKSHGDSFSRPGNISSPGLTLKRAPKSSRLSPL